ncbi:MAG: TetR family transcriptional regulator C-terminal domain-containing protein [Alphaproteobacteria bacterium]|nr:TetR family transcriptional regulator C-terminal domain-containing protein [Alphaproteobacteria bacterium]
MARAAETRRRTRIQIEKEKDILEAALGLFSSKGFPGTTLDEIAAAAGMSKPNLIYYFQRKEDVYQAVLNHTLEDWLEPLKALDPAGEPLAEINAYLHRKLALSRSRPVESRLFANEILQGAPQIGPILSGPLRDLVAAKVKVIQGWIDTGRLVPHNPYHLIFSIWATTQHYADFDVQVRAVMGEMVDEDTRFADAEAFLERVFLRGLMPD